VQGRIGSRIGARRAMNIRGQPRGIYFGRYKADMLLTSSAGRIFPLPEYSPTPRIFPLPNIPASPGGFILAGSTCIQDILAFYLGCFFIGAWKRIIKYSGGSEGAGGRVEIQIPVLEK
jgi:hypothetical protein